MPGGRPLKFESVEELQGKIDAYFLSCHGDKEDTARRPPLDPVPKKTDDVITATPA